MKEGPKRRKTLRKINNDNFIKLIQEVIEDEKNKQMNEKKIEENKNIDSTKRESILLNYNDKNKLNHTRQSLNLIKFDHKKINNNFGETEINNLQILNLNNTSNYISDANYACMPRKFSPKK